jgi:membrane protease YdiL (CAAX protease family)
MKPKPNYKWKKLFWNASEKRIRMFWRVSLHSGLLLLLMMLLTTPVYVISFFGQLFPFSWINTMVFPALTFLAIMIATYLAGRFLDKRRVEDFGFKFSKRWWLDFSFGLALGACLMGMIFALGWLSGTHHITGYFQSAGKESPFIIGFIQVLVLFIFVGIYEEMLSRGYYLVNLAEGLNLKRVGGRNALLIAWVLTSLVFGLMHLGNPNATWVSTLNISIAGLFLGLGMVLTGSLAIPIGLHITWNFFQGVVFGFPVSGVNFGTAVIATKAVGPQWLTGGPFGPEAGVMGLAAMGIGSGLILLWVKRRGGVALKTDLTDYQPVNKQG